MSATPENTRPSPGGLFAQAALDALSAHITIIDDRRTVVQSNAAWRARKELRGADPHEDSCHDLLVCDHATGSCTAEAQAVAAGIDTVLAGTRDEFSLEYACHSPGEKRWFMARINGFCFENRRYAVVAHEDISARKRIEESLADSEARFRDILEHSPIGMAILSLDGHYVRSNRALSEIMGYTPEELAGMTVMEVTHPADLHLDRVNRARLLGGQVSSYSIEKRYIRKSSRPVWAQVTVSLLRDQHGAPLYYIGQIEDISERKRSQEEIEHLAYYDALTDLPNRRLMQERLRSALYQAQRFQRAIAVMFLDLDHFKAVNDTLGHDVGDQLLKAVATRLLGCVRQGDTVARQGGDEFIVVLPEIATPEDAAIVADKIIARLAEPFMLGEHEVKIGTSIGIAVCPVDGSDDPGELMRKADLAMYQAKDGGRGSYRFFTDTPPA